MMKMMTTMTMKMRTMTTDLSRSYYCSLKFRYFKIDLVKNTTYNCHIASPHNVDFNWVESNPGQLFNTDINVTERKMMLQNERNVSCENTCWKAEDCTNTSPRLAYGGDTKTHNNIYATPEILDLVLNNDCNLTCSYCSKDFSSAWRQDLLSYGDFEINHPAEYRYKIDQKDKILRLISQNTLFQSSQYQSLLTEIQSYSKTLKTLIITGGEPLLNSHLLKFLKSLELSNDCKIIISTGLGINYKRFKNIINVLQKMNNIHIIVSGENIDKFLEFNRYGINWADFKQKIDLLNHTMNWSFQSVISNLTVMGFSKFWQNFSHLPIDVKLVYHPQFMNVCVLDNETKNIIKEELKDIPYSLTTDILQSIDNNPTVEDKTALVKFLNRFVSSRPDINLDIFPSSFLTWINNKHVV